VIFTVADTFPNTLLTPIMVSIVRRKPFQRTDYCVATAAEHMGVYFRCFYIAMPDLFLHGADVTYMDVGYAGFAGAKTGQHRVPVNALQKNDAVCGSWRDD
jgi:hypothetical protein